MKTTLIIVAINALGAALAAFVMQLASAPTPTQLAKAAKRAKASRFTTIVAKIGAATQIACSFGLLAGLLGIFAHVAYPHSALLTWSVIALFSGLGIGVVGLVPVLTCRCPSCGGWIFDNTQPARKNFLREDWMILRNRGRCSTCLAPLRLLHADPGPNKQA